VFDSLRGERVLVRPYVIEDAHERFEAMEESRERIRAWDPDDAATCRTLDETRFWITRKTSQWARREAFSAGIWRAATGAYLGGLGLHLRQPGGWSVPAFAIGYWVRPSAEGFGYVREAVKLVVDYAFESLQAQRIEILVDPENTRSLSIPRNLGFVLEGRARNVYRYQDGRLCDELVWSLIPSDRQADSSAGPAPLRE